MSSDCTVVAGKRANDGDVCYAFAFPDVVSNTWIGSCGESQKGDHDSTLSSCSSFTMAARKSRK